MSKEAMTLALEALKYDADYDTSVTLQKAAIYALENAIADAEKQEPYADVVSHWHYWMAEADKYRFALQNLEEALAKQEKGDPVAYCEIHYLPEPCVQCEKEHESYNTTPQVAKQEQVEPFGWYDMEHGEIRDVEWNRLKPTYEGVWRPLYTTPQPAQKPLTDEQILRLLSRIDECAVRLPRGLREFARAIESAHGIKENT